jgi:hypothetical protein
MAMPPRRLAALMAGALSGALSGALPGAPPAAATDWSFSGFASQRVEADSDFGGGGSSAAQRDGEAAVGAVADLGVALRADTGRTRWLLAPGLRGTLYSSGDTNGVYPRFDGAVAHDAPRGGLDASLSVIPELTSASQFEDTGVVEQDAVQITVRGRVGGRWEADPRNTLSGGVSATVREFTETGGELTPTRSYGLDGGWRRAVSERTGLSLLADLRRFESDDASQGDSWSVAPRLGADHRLTPRSGVSASLGPSFLYDDEGDLTLGVVGDVTYDWAVDDQSFRIGLDQTLDQNSFGEVENRASLVAAWRQAIDQRQSVGVAARAGFQNPAFDSGARGDRTFLTATPSYAIRITPDWDLSVGYSLRLTDDDRREPVSHLAFLSVTRGMSFLP